MNKKIILVVKQVNKDPDDIVSTYYTSKEAYEYFTNGDKIIKEATIKIENNKLYKFLENELANSEIDIENWIDYELNQETIQLPPLTTMKEITFNPIPINKPKGIE